MNLGGAEIEKRFPAFHAPDLALVGPALDFVSLAATLPSGVGL